MLERQPGEKNWHSRSVTDVVSAFETDIDTGLTSTEASDRLQAFGLNVVQEQAQEPWWQALIRQFVSPLMRQSRYAFMTPPSWPSAAA